MVLSKAKHQATDGAENIHDFLASAGA